MIKAAFPGLLHASVDSGVHVTADPGIPEGRQCGLTTRTGLHTLGLCLAS